MSTERAKKLLAEIMSDDEEMPEVIDVSIVEEEPKPQMPERAIQDSVKETPGELLDKTSAWAANGGSLELSSADGLRHLLAESRDRSSMFMAVMALQRMKRISRLVSVTDKLEESLFSDDRIAGMETMELIQALKHVDGTVKQAIDFVNKSTEDSTTGAQILVNLIDARSLTLSREDVPEARSRESIRHAVMGLLEQFQKPAVIPTEDTEVADG
jgi:hypothetical protein